MRICRHYTLHASPGSAPALLDSIEELVSVLKTIEGFGGFQLLRASDDPEKILFIENWDSDDAAQASMNHIPKPIFATMMSTLNARPDAMTLEILSAE